MSRKLIVEIVGDASSLERAFKKSSKSASGFEKHMSKTASRTKGSFGGLTRGVTGLAGAFVGTAGLATAARAAFGEMAEGQKVTAQTNAVLKSTGRAAHVSAKQVDQLAEALMTKSGVDDEVIKSGENMLLTFRDVRNETGKGNKIFDEATKAALDMSVALGRDMSQSAMQVGKALNDPVKGVTALRRVGVQFTDSQQDQIKALTESGNKLKAQKIILRELNKEFGGSARAAGQTLPGKLNVLRNTLLNLGGSIATMLTPEVKKLADKMVEWLSKTKNQKAILDNFKAAIGAVKDVVVLLKGAFDLLNGITGDTKRTFKILLASFIVFKGLKLASYIAKMAAAMKSYAIWSARSSVPGGPGGYGGPLGRGGKAAKAGRLARLGKLARLAPLAFAGDVAVAGAGAYAGAKGLQKLIGQAPYLISPRGAMGGVRGPINVNLHVDGKKLATVTAHHNENALAHRRKQRAHARRSIR